MFSQLFGGVIPGAIHLRLAVWISGEVSSYVPTRIRLLEVAIRIFDHFVYIDWFLLSYLVRLIIYR